MVALGMVHAETVRKRQMPRRHRRVDGDRDDDARALGGEARVPIPTKPGDPGIVTGDDVRGILQMQNLKGLGPGDCVALHTGQGNSWSNDRYKSMNCSSSRRRLPPRS